MLILITRALNCEQCQVEVPDEIKYEQTKDERTRGVTCVQNFILWKHWKHPTKFIKLQIYNGENFRNEVWPIVPLYVAGCSWPGHSLSISYAALHHMWINSSIHTMEISCNTSYSTSNFSQYCEWNSSDCQFSELPNICWYTVISTNIRHILPHLTQWFLRPPPAHLQFMCCHIGRS